MKKSLWFLPLLLLLVLMAGCNAQAVVEDEIMMYGYESTGESVMTVGNDYLELDFYPDTTEFTLRNKKTGEEWYSNPAGGAEDGLADANIKALLQSQFSLTFSNINGVPRTFTNRQFSTVKGLYEVEQLPNGFAVRYTVGDIDRRYVLPVAVPESRMMEFYENFERKDQRKIEEYYRIYDINKLRKDDDEEYLRTTYPDIVDEPIYVLRDNPAHIKLQLETLFESYGYTEEDYEADLARYSVASNLDLPIFNVSVYYELDGDAFKVSVPFDEIRYKNDYPITGLTVLPYFGCGGLEDEGYLFIPDGSGALLGFNNGKQNVDSVVTNVYGYDSGLFRDLLVVENRAQMPVFGVYRNNATLFCVIEDGSPYAVIEAGVSRYRSSFNNVYARYNLIRGETMDISAKSDKTVMLYQRDLPAGEKIVQNYVLCEREGYMGMAEYYRQYLIDKYNLKRINAGSVPTAVEFTGAISKVRFILGLPADLPLKLTSYSEAEEMVKDISNRGWENVSYKLTGWFNDGVQHSVPSRIKLINELGSKKDLLALSDAVTATGGDLYMEADFVLMKENSLFDSFSTYDDAARYINRKRVTLYQYAIANYIPADWTVMSYLATPAYSLELIDGFVQKIGDYGSKNVAFRNIGTNLSANYNEKDATSRQATLNLQSAKLAEIQASGGKTMVKNGNDYALICADFITDTMFSQNPSSITDASIPFYEIVLHGLVRYTGGAINLASDYQGNLMRSVEAGAGLYFSFINENAILLQDTIYYEYYANQYELWIEEADRIYQQINNDLAHCAAQFITDHEILAPNVTKTVYEDGTYVVVNHSVAAYDYEGKSIPSRSYIAVKGGGAQ